MRVVACMLRRAGDGPADGGADGFFMARGRQRDAEEPPVPISMEMGGGGLR